MKSERIIAAVATDLEAQQRRFGELDAIAGDGDLGVTVSIAVRSVLALLPEISDLDVGATLMRIGQEIGRKAPSTCGSLSAAALVSAGRALDRPDVTRSESEAFAHALRAATAMIAELGGAKIGEKTMLDALQPATDAAIAAAKTGLPMDQALSVAAEAASVGAASTASMRPVHGRAGWLAERSAGSPDAGATVAAQLLTSLSYRLSQK